MHIQTPLKLDEVEKLTGIPEGTLRTRLNRKTDPRLVGVKVPVKPGSVRLVWALTPEEVEYLLSDETATAADYEKMLNTWLQQLANGYHTGKPASQTTIGNYTSGMIRFWKYMGTCIDPEKNEWKPRTASIKLMTAENVRATLAKYPLDAVKRTCSYESKMQTLNALRSFAQLLVREKLMTTAEYDAICKIEVKRVYPPRKTVLKEDQLQALLEKVKTQRGQSAFERLRTETIIKLMAYAGVRRKEVIGLHLHNIDLGQGLLHVIDGKNHKNRIVGIVPELEECLVRWLATRPAGSDRLLVFSDGRPYTLNALRCKMQRLSVPEGVEITAHGLRRTFATLMSKEGMPLDMLRISLGHNDLKVTQGYLLTDAMDAAAWLRNKGQLPPVETQTAMVKRSKAEKLAMLEALQKTG